MAHKVKFQYPVFTARGFECFLQVEADVEFYQPAHHDEHGAPTECDTPDNVEITSLMFDGYVVSSGIDVNALPIEMINEIKDCAYDKAKEELENEYDYEFEASPAAY